MTKKGSFTLLEILLCLALIAVACVSSFSLPRLLSHERFEKEVRLVQQKIELVQELMVDLECSFSLCFDQEERGVRLTLIPNRELPQKWLRSPLLLKQISSVAFDQEQTKHLELYFDGLLGGCPQGNLQLRGKREVTLYLPGFPGKIKKGEGFCDGKDATFPQEIFSFA